MDGIRAQSSPRQEIDTPRNVLILSSDRVTNPESRCLVCVDNWCGDNTGVPGQAGRTEMFKYCPRAMIGDFGSGDDRRRRATTTYRAFNIATRCPCCQGRGYFNQHTQNEALGMCARYFCGHVRNRGANRSFPSARCPIISSHFQEGTRRNFRRVLQMFIRPDPSHSSPVSPSMDPFGGSIMCVISLKWLARHSSWYIRGGRNECAATTGAVHLCLGGNLDR